METQEAKKGRGWIWAIVAVMGLLIILIGYGSNMKQRRKQGGILIIQQATVGSFYTMVAGEAFYCEEIVETGELLGCMSVPLEELEEQCGPPPGREKI